MHRPSTNINADLHAAWLHSGATGACTSFLRPPFSRSTLLPLVFGALLFTGCAEDFVYGGDPFIDQIEDDRLTDEAQVPFLLAGLEGSWASVADDLALAADGLSDHFFFDSNVIGATSTAYDEIDDGTISLHNEVVETVYQGVQEVRFLADTLTARLDRITFSDAGLERDARFAAHLYGALARTSLATYFALEPDRPGAPLYGGPFVDADDLHAQADALLADALIYADEAQRRAANTLRARIALYQGRHAEADAFAAIGMAIGEAFVARYAERSANAYWLRAGRGGAQYAASGGLVDFLRQDANEAVRVTLYSAPGRFGTPYLFQERYPQALSDFPIVTGSEAALIRAEVAVRAGDPDAARGFLNAVRARYGTALSPIPPEAPVPLEEIAVERAKELFAMGLRLIDQRRLPTPGGVRGWGYLPIPASERGTNGSL